MQNVRDLEQGQAEDMRQSSETKAGLLLTSMLSSFICNKKQLDICGRHVPALNIVGEA